MKKLVCLFLVLCAAVASGNMTPELVEDGVRYWYPDFTEDWWEAMYPTACDARLWNHHLDPDGDGWDNWSEARYSAKAKQAARPDKSDSYPIPDIKFIIKNTSNVTQGRVVVFSYDSQQMNGTPVSTFVFDLRPGDFEHATKVAEQGHLTQGNTWFFAFIDSNNNRKWDTGEPAGLSTEFPYQVGWDKNTVTFVLSNNPVNGFVRVSWPEDRNAAGYVVSLQRRTYTGVGTNAVAVYTTIYAKSIAAPRNWLHEGDILDSSAYGGGNPGLDWGGTISTPGGAIPIGTTSTYRLVVNGTAIEPLISLYYPPDGQVLPTPTLVSPPTGAMLVSPDLRFRFTAPYEASAYELQLLPLVTMTPGYSTGLKALPLAIDAKGTREVYLPVKLGDEVTGAKPYPARRWRVRVFQPRDPNVTQSNYSPLSVFDTKIDSTAEWINNHPDMATYGWWGLTVTCSLPHVWRPSLCTVRHQVFTTASFNGIPVAQRTTVATNTLTSTTFYGLQKDIPYYIRSYVDTDNLNRYAAWKTSGYHIITNAANKWLWQPAPVYATYPPKTYDVEPHFSDINNNMLADEYEWTKGVVFPD